MVNKLDEYDINKLEVAREFIYEVYRYNYKSRSDSLTQRLETILKKINKVIETYGEEGL